MRYAFIMAPAIRNVLAMYESGLYTREEAHLELRQFDLLDVEIGGLLDDIDGGELESTP